MSRAVLAVWLQRVGCIETYCICTAAIEVAMVMRSIDAVKLSSRVMLDCFIL